MIGFPPAKINLGLRIKGRRPDGYHDIESVMYPVPLCDVLEVCQSERGDSLLITGAELDCATGDNLVIRAVDLLRKNYRIPPLQIHLHKMIPFGAGLGGGSSDAAETIKICQRLLLPGMTETQMLEIASEIGSDCPFFIKNKPALATGRGEVLEPNKVDLSGYFLVIVKPDIEISTRWAYGLMVNNSESAGPELIVKQPVSEWKHLLVNDFESPLINHFPILGNIKDHLYNIGAEYASLTGSGSAVYGLFTHRVEAGYNDLFCWCGWL